MIKETCCKQHDIEIIFYYRKNFERHLWAAVWKNNDKNNKQKNYVYCKGEI